MKARIDKILIVLLSLTVLGIFLLPFGWVFFVGDEKAHWEKMYLIEDWLSLMFYLPFVILWAIYLMRPKSLNFLLFKFLLVGTGFTAFAISFLSSVMPGQDYEPGWGTLLSLFIFPLLIVFLINRKFLPNVK